MGIGCSCVGSALSMVLGRIASSVCSALQGGMGLTKIVLFHTDRWAEEPQRRQSLWSKRMTIGKYLFADSPTEHSAKLDSREAVLTGFFALVGLLLQFHFRFKLPLVLRIPLFPFILIERIL